MGKLDFAVNDRTPGVPFGTPGVLLLSGLKQGFHGDGTGEFWLQENRLGSLRIGLAVVPGDDLGTGVAVGDAVEEKFQLGLGKEMAGIKINDSL